MVVKNAAKAGDGAVSDVSLCVVMMTDGSEECCRGWSWSHQLCGVVCRGDDRWQ